VSAPVANPEEEGVDRGALLRQYRGVIARTVHRKYVYPRNAIRAGLQGRVIVEIMVDGEGNITSRKVIQSSGHAVLDRAALEAISRIEKLPRPPSALHWTARAMRLPFVYELRS
jgi:protein TonB